MPTIRLINTLTCTAALGLLISACAPATRVILLPQADGKPSAVTITAPQSGQSLLLNTPFSAADTSTRGDLKTRALDPKEVQETLKPIEALKPRDPQQFTLFFQPGTSKLTEESEATLPTVIAAAKARKGGEIVVTGHTDRQGAVEANDALSLKRAQVIKELLVAKDFTADLVDAIGRGEREPVVPTDDEVAEPRNRRAELVVR